MRHLSFFELLSRCEENGKLETIDRSEEWVLSALHGKLERQLAEPFDPDYRELLARAREWLRKHVE